MHLLWSVSRTEGTWTFSTARDAGSKHGGGGGDSKGGLAGDLLRWEHSEEEGGRDLEL